jgi:hypothetical protein
MADIKFDLVDSEACEGEGERGERGKRGPVAIGDPAATMVTTAATERRDRPDRRFP